MARHAARRTGPAARVNPNPNPTSTSNAAHMDAAPLEPQQGRSSAFARVNGAASATADTAVFINFVKNVTAAHDVEPLPPGMLPVGHRTSAHSTPVTSAANTPISGSPLVGPLPSPRVPALHYPVPVPVQYGYGAFALPPPAAADPASVAVKQERPRAMYVTDGSYYFPACTSREQQHNPPVAVSSPVLIHSPTRAPSFFVRPF